jgi:polar amino acid transport system substrate-binding protein
VGCVGTIAGVTTALTLASAEPVVIGTEVPFPPYTQLDARGEIVGFDRDIGDEVCRRAALACDWVATRFDLLLPGVMSGEFDIAMAGISVTTGRKKLVAFTTPYEEGDDEASFLGRPDAPLPDQARIGVQSGTIHEDHLRATGRAFQSFATAAEVLTALEAGTVDLAFGAFDDARLETLAQTASIEPRSSETVPGDGVAMVVCKGNDALLRQLDFALAGMLSDGTIDEIAGRW